MDDDERLLAEMVREAERIVDRQADAMAEHDDKSQQAVGLAIAVFGGAIAVATFAQRFGQCRSLRLS